MQHVAVRHADDVEDAGLHEGLPGEAADRLDDFSGHAVEDVVVGVGAAKARRGLDVAEPPRDLLAVIRGGWPPEQVNLMSGCSINIHPG